MNSKRKAALGLMLALATAPGASRAVQLMSSNDLTIDIGGVFQETGELENTSNSADSPYYKATANGPTTMPNTQRDNTRVYLFQTEDLLRLSADYKGAKFYFEEDLGGGAINTSNNQFNLYEAYADVPVVKGLDAIVGQFQVPSNLASAQDPGDLLFTESSPLFQDFFNQGYDNGVGLKSWGKGWDATAGVLSGSPDLPQRYLPEMFNLPPLVYTRFGIGNIEDDPYQQKQAVLVKHSEWGLHFNGQYMNDSNAGHTDQLGLQNSAAQTQSSGTVFGNALTWSNWNPFMGKTATGMGTSPVNSNYWDASVDSQFRTPLGNGLTLILSGQWSFAQFNNNAMDPTQATDYNNAATINLTGGEFVAGINSDVWALAARFDVVCPSSNLIYNSSVASVSTNNRNFTNLPAYQPNSIFGGEPIFEITFPSLSYRINKYMRLTAEGLYWLNSPEASGDDGVYELLEMPSQVTNLFPGNGTNHNPFVATGRMAFVANF